MNILTATSNAYAPYAGTMLCSLFENNKDENKICVYLLGDKLTDENIAKFKTLAEKYGREIVFPDTEPIEKLIKNSGITEWRGSLAANYSFFAPGFIDTDDGKLLIIEADIVVNGSLHDMYETDINRYIFAAVVDTSAPWFKKRLELKQGEKYYNFGVVLINVYAYRSRDCTGLFLHEMKRNDVVYTAVFQDVFNKFFNDEILELDIRYNYYSCLLIHSPEKFMYLYALDADNFYALKTVLDAKDSAVIYHYLGGTINGRPWEEGNNCAKRELFDKYINMTQWKNTKKLPGSHIFRSKVQKLLFAVLPISVYRNIQFGVQQLYVKLNLWNK